MMVVTVNDAKKLAAITGPAIMALSASEFFNFHIWKESHPQTVYLNGFFLLLVGLYLLRGPWIKQRNWSVLFTLVGAGATGLGLFRMFFPEWAPASGDMSLRWSLIPLFGLGLFLTFKAYFSASQ